MEDRGTATANSEDRPIWVQDLIAWLKRIEHQKLNSKEQVRQIQEVLAELTLDIPTQLKLLQETLEYALGSYPNDLNDHELCKVVDTFAVHVSSELILKAIEKSRTLQYEPSRSKVLAAIAPYLPPEQALETIQKVKDRKHYIQALVRVVPDLPPRLLQQELGKALEIGIGEEPPRSEVFAASEVLAAIAPYLPPEQALKTVEKISIYSFRVLAEIELALPPEQVLETIFKIEKYDHEWLAAIAPHPLARIAPKLSNEQLQKVLKMAQDLPPTEDAWQSIALVSIAPHLSAEDLQKVLETALKMKDPIHSQCFRSKALEGIVPHISSERMQQTLDMFLALKAERYKFQGALAAITPYLTPKMLQQALQEVLTLEDGHPVPFSESLATIAPYLPPEQAIETVLRIKDKDYQKKALAAVVIKLPPEFLQQAWEIALNVDESAFSQVLGVFLPRLAPKLLEEALEKVQKIQNKSLKASALATIAPHLSPKQALEIVLKMNDPTYEESYRASALAGIAPHLPFDLLEQALETALKLSSVFSRIKALSGIIPYLPRKQALETVLKMNDNRYSAKTFSEIAHHFSNKQNQLVLQQALETARTIQDKDDQSRILAAIALYLSPKEALKKVLSIENETYKYQALATITSYLPIDLLQQVVEMALESRDYCKPFFTLHLPPEQALEIVKNLAGKKFDYSYPAFLEETAPNLPPTILQQALRIVHSIKDKYYQSNCYLALVAHLPPEQAMEIVEKKIARDFDQYEALGRIAPKLSPELLQKALKIALGLNKTISGSSLEKIVAYLPPEQALEVVKEINGRGIERIIPHCTPELLQKALKIVLSINLHSRASALISIIPYLPPEQALEILQESQGYFYHPTILAEVVSHIHFDLLLQVLKMVLQFNDINYPSNDKDCRSKVLVGIASRLQLNHALEIAQNIKEENDRFQFLMGITPRLTSKLLQQALKITSSFISKEVQVLYLDSFVFKFPEKIVSYLATSQISTLLEAISQGKNAADQSKLLSALVPRLSPGLFPRVLEIIENHISHPIYQVESLGNLAPYLPSTQLSEALTLTKNIPGVSYLAAALCYLIPFLPLNDLVQVFDLAHERCNHPDLKAKIFLAIATRLASIGVANPTLQGNLEQSVIRDQLKGIQQRLLNCLTRAPQTPQKLPQNTVLPILIALVPSLSNTKLLEFQEFQNLVRQLPSESDQSKVLVSLAISSDLPPSEFTSLQQWAEQLQQELPKATALSALIPHEPTLRQQISNLRNNVHKSLPLHKASIAVILASRPKPSPLMEEFNLSLAEDQSTALRCIRGLQQHHQEFYKAELLIKLSPHLLTRQVIEAQSIALELQDRYHQARSLLALATYFPEIRAQAERQIATLQVPDPIQHIELLSQFATTVPEQIPTILKAIEDWADHNKFNEDPKEPDRNTYKRRRILIALKPHLPIRLVREIDRQTGIGKAPQDLWERALFVLRNEYRQALKTGSLRNDSTQDEDLLNLKDEINALTEMLLMRDLEPPVTVGILGGWGGGKSYIMHLMQIHMVAIRSQKMEEAIEAWGFKDDKITSPDGDRVGRFVGHIYQIKFDAWTYAKANLWASLMQEIFYELNRQISLEQKLGHILSNLDRSSVPEAVPESASSKQRSKSYLEQFIYDPLSNTKKTIQQSIQQVCQYIFKKLTAITQKILNFWIVQFILHITIFAIVVLNLILFAPIRYIFKKSPFITNILPSFARDKFNKFVLFVEKQFNELESQANKYYFPHDLPDKSESNRKFNKIELVLQSILFLIFFGFPKRLNDRREYWKQISDTKSPATQDSTSPESESDLKTSIAFGQAMREGGKFWQVLYLMNEEERNSFLQSNLKPSQFKDWKDSASKTEISNSLWALLDQIKQDEKQLFKQKEQILETKEKELQRQLKKAEEDVNQRLAQRSVTAFLKPVINAVAKLHFSDEKIKEFTETGKTYTMLSQAVTSWQGLLALFTMTLLVVLTLDSATRTAIITGIQALLGKFGIADWFNQLIQSILIWFESLPQWIKEISKEVLAAFQILAAITATVTALLPILKSLGNYITSFQKEQADIQSKREVWLKEEQDKVAAGLFQEVASLKLQVDEQRREVGLTADFSSLLDFVNSRLKDGDYSKHLGLMHQFKDDLWKLSNSLLPPANASEFKAKLDKLKQIFPRGPARVVIYIDDLDRCPPNTVVEVLEAVQLLVKNPLFIAVLAIDERYINRALAQHYKGVLSLQGSPSSADYLEKIIQIPYRVRPIAEDALRSYLRAQIVVQDSETSGTKFNEFSPQEFDLLVTCCQEVELSPRSLKRLTNVYKLYKILSRTRGQRPTPREQQAILVLLAFSSRYPNLMRDILQEIGSHYEEGRDKVEDDSETLVSVFNTACDKYDNLPPNSHLAQDAKKLRHDVKQLVADDLKLNEIHDIFTFVRTFSFVGDIGVDVTAYATGDRFRGEIEKDDRIQGHLDTI